MPAAPALSDINCGTLSSRPIHKGLGPVWFCLSRGFLNGYVTDLSDIGNVQVLVSASSIARPARGVQELRRRWAWSCFCGTLIA